MKYHPLLEQQLKPFIRLRNNENDRFLRQISLAYEEFENKAPRFWSTQRQQSITHQLIGLQNEIEANRDLASNIRTLCRRGSQLLQAASLGLWHIDREQMIAECECEYIVKANDFIANKYEIINHADNLEQTLLNQRYIWHATETTNDPWQLDIPINIDQFSVGFLRAQFFQPHPEAKALCAALGATLGDFMRAIYLQHRRQLTLDELEESEHRFKALAESTGAAIFAFRETMIYANKATEELIGLDHSSLRLLPISIILGVDFAKRFNEHTLSNKRKAIGVEIEFSRPSGEIRWAFINVAQTHYAGQHTWLASAFDITERKRAEIQLRFQAYHDSLTSLPNRIQACKVLDNCLTKASRDRYYRFAAAIIEIQELNILTEQLGFHSSDHYLIDIALKLKNFSQITDHIAKVSHNSFVFIRENINSKDDIAHTCKALLENLKEPLVIDDLPISQPMNIGITYCDRLYQSGEEVLRHCSIAAQSKAESADPDIAFFTDTLLQKIEQQKAVASKLRQAINHDELAIHFAPQHSTRQHAIHIYEALIHWKEIAPCRLGDKHFKLLHNDSPVVMQIAHWLINAAANDSASLPTHPIDGNAVWVDLSSLSLRNAEDFFALLPTREVNQQTPKLILQIPMHFITLTTHSACRIELDNYIRQLQENHCALAINLSELSLNQLEQLPESGITYARLDSFDNDERRTGKALMQMTLKYCSMLGIQIIIDRGGSQPPLALAHSALAVQQTATKKSSR